ncbi:MAG: DUF6113 family protein [Actinomycetes bacterium]
MIRPSQVLFGVTTLALGVVAVMLALVGAFYSPAHPHVLGVPVPVGVLIAIVGNLVVGIGAAWGLNSRVAPAVTGFVWLVVAFILGSSRPEGDVVVSGSGWLGVSYLFLGATAAAVAIAVGPRGAPRRRPKPAVDPSLEPESRR